MRYLPHMLLSLAMTSPFAAADEALSQASDPAAPAWYETFSFNLDEVSAPATDFEGRDDSFSIGWNTKGRWSVNLNLITRPEDSPRPREEMSAAAEYSFTPRFSVGGELSVGANELDDTSQWHEQQIEAGVRLETAFKF